MSDARRIRTNPPGLKNGAGQYVRPESLVPKDERKQLDAIDPLPPPIVSKKELSVDDLMIQGLLAIYEVMRRTRLNVRAGNPSREDIANLKDCMTMLHDLKKVELEELENRSDEDLEKIAEG